LQLGKVEFEKGSCTYHEHSALGTKGRELECEALEMNVGEKAEK
jgi:hypothetical protein